METNNFTLNMRTLRSREGPTGFTSSQMHRKPEAQQSLSSMPASQTAPSMALCSVCQQEWWRHSVWQVHDNLLTVKASAPAV